METLKFYHTFRLIKIEEIGTVLAMETWGEYIQKTRNTGPRPLLIKALNFVQSKGEALDLGPGALNDSRYLLDQGFQHVTAVDKGNLVQEIINQLPKDKFGFIAACFEDFDFPESRFDLINAQYSLPFIGPARFNEVLEQIKKALKTGGIFTGQLFGNRDGWNTPGRQMTFCSNQQVANLFSGMEIIELIEEEKDEKPVVGGLKHWHIFHFIVRK